MSSLVPGVAQMNELVVGLEQTSALVPGVAQMGSFVVDLVRMSSFVPEVAQMSAFAVELMEFVRWNEPVAVWPLWVAGNLAVVYAKQL